MRKKANDGGNNPAAAVPTLLGGYPHLPTAQKKIAVKAPVIRRVVTAIDAHHMPLHFNASMHEPIAIFDNQRFMPVSSDNGLHLWGMMGSNYLSHNGAKSDLQLDAMHTQLTFSEAKVNSMCIALAKGKNARSICKFTNGYMAESVLLDDLNNAELQTRLLADVRVQQQKYPSQPYIFTGAKVFRDAAGKFHMLWFNVGSGLTLLYNPKTKEVINVLPAREMALGGAILGDFYDNEFLVEIKKDIPAGCLFLTMTRGIAQAITVKSEMKREPIRVAETDYDYVYHECTLRPGLIENIFRLLEPNDPVECYARALVQYATLAVERKRAETQRPENLSIILAHDLGGDLSVVVARIDPVAFDAAFRLCVVPSVFKFADERLATGCMVYKRFRTSKTNEDYQDAMSAFLEASALFREIDNHVGQIRAEIYMGELSFTMHSNCYKHKPRETDSPDYRLHKIQSAQKVLKLWEQFDGTIEALYFTSIGLLTINVVGYLVSTSTLLNDQYIKTGYQAKELADPGPRIIKETIDTTIIAIINSFPQRCSRIIGTAGFHPRTDKQALLEGLLEFINWLNTNTDHLEHSVSMTEVRQTGFMRSTSPRRTDGTEHRFKIDRDSYERIKPSLASLLQNEQADSSKAAQQKPADHTGDKQATGACNPM